MTEDTKIIGDAETLLRTHKYGEAVVLLKPLAAKNDLAKKLLWECYVALGDNKAMIADFYPPQTVAEIVYISDALWDEGDRVRLKLLLECDAVRDSLDPAVVTVRENLKAKLKL